MEEELKFCPSDEEESIPSGIKSTIPSSKKSTTYKKKPKVKKAELELKNKTSVWVRRQLIQASNNFWMDVNKKCSEIEMDLIEFINPIKENFESTDISEVTINFLKLFKNSLSHSINQDIYQIISPLCNYYLHRCKATDFAILFHKCTLHFSKSDPLYEELKLFLPKEVTNVVVIHAYV